MMYDIIPIILLRAHTGPAGWQDRTSFLFVSLLYTWAPKRLSKAIMHEATYPGAVVVRTSEHRQRETRAPAKNTWETRRTIPWSRVRVLAHRERQHGQ